MVSDGLKLCVTIPNINTIFNTCLVLISIFVFCFLPFILVIIFSVYIVFGLIKQTKFRKHNSSSFTDEKKTKSISIMLVTVSFMFIICSLPYCLLLTADVISRISSEVDSFQTHKFASTGNGYAQHSWNYV